MYSRYDETFLLHSAAYQSDFSFDQSLTRHLVKFSVLDVKRDLVTLGTNRRFDGICLEFPVVELESGSRNVTALNHLSTASNAFSHFFSNPFMIHFFYSHFDTLLSNN